MKDHSMTKIIQCLILSILFKLLATTSEGLSRSCSNMDSCMEMHLNRTYLRNGLKRRCTLDNLPNLNHPKAKITFSHLPKTGGTSVRTVLRTFAKDRIQAMGHEHFVLAALEQPHNIFITMLREPTSRAISFYTYANGVKKLSAAASANPLWVATHKASPANWSANPFIQRTLYQDPLGFFLRNITNITDSITRFDYGKIQRLPEVPLKHFILNDTLEDALSYTSNLPSEYQCKQHLEVGLILLKHYEVVGVLENTSEFYQVLFRRTNIRDSNTKKPHSNPSLVHLSPEDRLIMEKNLEKPLFCARVLWRIAGLISKADAAC